MIYIIGDSHVSVFSGTDFKENGSMHIQPEFGTCYTLKLGQLKAKINKFEQRVPNFLAIKVGSHTAYNSFNKLPKIKQAIDEYEIDKNDYVFLCFGQIDIQNHLIKNSLKNNISINETIDICLNRYIETILNLKTHFPNLRFGVYAPPSTSIGCGKYPKITPNEAINFNIITTNFNKKLKRLAEKIDVLYKDISDKLILENGLTDNKFVIDDIHLSQEAMPLLLKEFKDLI